jgi:predicted RNase H-like HicB family nuclease
MKYPVLIHKDENSDYGATLPDVPGCFTVGKTLDEVVRNLQEAVELYYAGEENTAPPPASRIEDIINRGELFTEGGFWMLADLDFSFLSKKTVRVNITLPAYKLAMIDLAAKKRGLSRSAFLIQAAEEQGRL